MSITMHSVASSQISEIGHDPATNTLAVRFKHGGTLYHYENFSAEKFKEFHESKSHGAYLGQHIKGAHNFKKIIEKKEGEEHGKK